MLFQTIVFAPLLGAIIAGLFGRKIGDTVAQSVTTGLLILAAVLSWIGFVKTGFGHTVTDVFVMRWFDVGDMKADWFLKIDTLTAVMLVVITSVSALVHLYSWGYMSHDDSKARFFAYLSLFTFAMLMLVTADNFIQLFFGWEGVGLAMEGPTPVSALIHAATMVTAGVFMVCRCFPIFEAAPITSGAIAIIGALTAFFAATVALVQNDIKRVIAYSTCSQLGYMFFAAGLGLYNAAMFHLFTHAFFKALLFLCAGSVIHALHHEQDMRKMGGTYKLIPLTYIFMIIGTLAITGVGIPGTKLGFAGFFSKDVIIEGAYAASAGGAYAPAVIAFVAGLIAALFTSFYSWRLIFITFHGKHRGEPDVLKHAHEAPPAMMIPLIMLAFGAVFAGMFFYKYFVGDYAAGFWAHALPADTAYSGTGVAPGMAAEAAQGAEAAHGDEHGSDHGDGHHAFPTWVLWSPFVAMVIGFVTAWLMYVVKGGAAKRAAASMRGEGGVLYKFLLNKWYVDEIYDVIFVKGLRRLGDFFWKILDVKIIDNLGPNGFAKLASGTAGKLSKLQSGYLFHYALVMLIGVAAIIVLVFSKVSGG